MAMISLISKDWMEVTESCTDIVNIIHDHLTDPSIKDPFICLNKKEIGKVYKVYINYNQIYLIE